MTWFKVDDSFHSHPKALAASPTALGLWAVAGSWSGANLSDGFIPDHVLPRLDDLARIASHHPSWRRCCPWRRRRGVEPVVRRAPSGGRQPMIDDFFAKPLALPKLGS